MLVYIIAALTADGFIGQSEDHRSTNWTTEEDTRFYVQKIKEADAIIIGAKTFATFHRYPKGSNWIIYTRSPEKFTNPKPHIITASATNETPQKLIAQLSKQGLKKVAIVGGSSIYTLFIETNVVNKFYLSIEALTFGQGVNLFNKPVNKQLSLIQVHHLSSQTIVLEYDILR